MEAERERSVLEAALQKAEEGLQEARAQYERDRTLWKKMKLELENRVREAEEKQTAVQAALREASDRLTAIEKALPVLEKETESGMERP